MVSKKTWFLILLVIAVVAIVWVINESISESLGGPADIELAASDLPTDVDVRVSQYAFSPDPIEVPADVPVRFHVRSIDGLDHGFVIDGVIRQRAVAGKDLDVEVTLPAGEYLLYSDRVLREDGSLLNATVIAR